MIVLGLTGSIGMGKTTTAAMFEAQGAAVYDADAAVHELYGPGGLAGPVLKTIFPHAVTDAGEVRRDALKAALIAAPDRLQALEMAVFPLLAAQRMAFLARSDAEGRGLAVLDIPLLYETGAETTVDAVVVVTASPEVQRQRVLARPGMDASTFELLSARQLDDADKRRRADFLVFTDRGLEDAATQVHGIVETVLAPGWVGRRSTPMVARISAPGGIGRGGLTGEDR